MDGNRFKIGITDHAQAALGDVVFVELPELETEVDAGGWLFVRFCCKVLLSSAGLFQHINID